MFAVGVVLATVAVRVTVVVERIALLAVGTFVKVALLAAEGLGLVPGVLPEGLVLFRLLLDSLRLIAVVLRVIITMIP
jgi:hypothetical protein